MKQRGNHLWVAEHADLGEGILSELHISVALQCAVDGAGDGITSVTRNFQTLLNKKLPGNMAIMKAARIKKAVMTHFAGGLGATFRAMQEFEAQNEGAPHNGLEEAQLCARLKYHTYRCNGEFDYDVVTAELFNAVEQEIKRYGLVIKLPYYNAMRDAIVDRIGLNAPAYMYMEPIDGIDMPN